MLIVGLTIGIVVAVGIIFLVIKSLALKLLSLALLVVAFTLVIALGGDKLNQFVKPFAIDHDTVQIYQEGKPVQFKVSDVRRVDVTKDVEGGLIVTFTVEGFTYSFSTNKISYEWALKNKLNKEFGMVLYDTTN